MKMTEFPSNPTPRALWKAYSAGFAGSLCDPEDVSRLLGELPHPIFGAAAYELNGSGENNISLPFKSLLKFDPGFGPAERQTTGDCVSHATRNAVDVTRAVEIDIGQEPEEFASRGATEAIYGSRGHTGQGMSCSRAARFVHDDGGILLRKDYGFVNLSTYDGNTGHNWGRRGVPNEVAKEGQKHQVRTVSLITSWGDARDALANGYALTVCSGLGFSSRRDSNGYAKQKGSWSHAMTFIACNDTREKGGPGLLVQNSWGHWNGGPKTHDQPDGSFWVTKRTAEQMINARGTWVFSSVDGFPPRNLPDYGGSLWG